MRTGHVVWHELMTDDPETAQEFYAELLGWSGRAADDSNLPYQVLNDGYNDVGGFFDTEQSQTGLQVNPTWFLYVSVEDIERACEFTEANGGRVVAGPKMADDVGGWATVRDLQGAPFALLELADQPREAHTPPRPGEFCSYLMRSSGGEESLVFSQLVCDEQTDTPPADAAGEPFLFHRDGRRVARLQVPGSLASLRAGITAAIAVDDLEATGERVEQLGGTVVLPTASAGPLGRLLIAEDPTGARVSFLCYP